MSDLLAGTGSGVTGSGVSVPSHFTWALVFTGVDSGADAGPVISTSGPSIGADLTDYWQNNPPWETYTNSSYSIDFVAQFGGTPNIVPEPQSFSLLAMVGLAGLTGVFIRRRFARQ